MRHFRLVSIKHNYSGYKSAGSQKSQCSIKISSRHIKTHQKKMTDTRAAPLDLPWMQNLNMIDTLSKLEERYENKEVFVIKHTMNFNHSGKKLIPLTESLNKAYKKRIAEGRKKGVKFVLAPMLLARQVAYHYYLCEIEITSDRTGIIRYYDSCNMVHALTMDEDPHVGIFERMLDLALTVDKTFRVAVHHDSKKTHQTGGWACGFYTTLYATLRLKSIDPSNIASCSHLEESTVTMQRLFAAMYNYQKAIK
jgi:hypothetical protein